MGSAGQDASSFLPVNVGKSLCTSCTQPHSQVLICITLLIIQSCTFSNKSFKCKSGQCIDAAKMCDGKTDCSDNSDETVGACANMMCEGYRCAYGACVSGSAKCNGIKECFDGSDESHPDCSITTRNNFA